MQGLPSLSQAMQVISSLVVNISLPKNISATTNMFSRKFINTLEWGGRHQKKTIMYSQHCNRHQIRDCPKRWGWDACEPLRHPLGAGHLDDDDGEHDEAGDARWPSASLQGGGVSRGIPETETEPAQPSLPTGSYPHFQLVHIITCNRYQPFLVTGINIPFQLVHIITSNWFISLTRSSSW